MISPGHYSSLSFGLLSLGSDLNHFLLYLPSFLSLKEEVRRVPRDQDKGKASDLGEVRVGSGQSSWLWGQNHRTWEVGDCCLEILLPMAARGLISLGKW